VDQCVEDYGYDIRAMREDYERRGLVPRLLQALRVVTP
jgi:hypothetical protein